MNYLARAKQAEARLSIGAPNSTTPPAGPPADPKTGVGAPEETQSHGDELAALLAMPLNQFERASMSLEIRVPWHGVTLWFVPGDVDAARLERAGISRGRVWTARELADLLGVSKLTRGQVRTVALAKLEFAGELVSTACLVQTGKVGQPKTCTSISDRDTATTPNGEVG